MIDARPPRHPLVADIVAKARRVARDFNPENEPGKTPTAATMLLIAYCEEVRAQFDDYARNATGFTAEAIEMAMKHAAAKHGVDAIDAICGGAGVPPCYQRILTRENDMFDPWIDKACVVVEMLMPGTAPLWAQYLPWAQAQIVAREETK